MTNKWLGVVLCGCAAVIPACGDGAGDPGPMLPPADLGIEGGYQVVSTYDLTVGTVLPQPVAEYAQVIVKLRGDPAGTFFALLDAAGVPLASDLLGALPSVARDQVKGWINDAILSDTYNGASVASELDALAGAIETVLTRFDVASDLELPAPDAQGSVAARHTLEELRYRLYGGSLTVVVPIVAPPDALAGLLVRERPVTGRVSAARGAEDARLVLDDHAFGIPYGSFALAAINEAARQRSGTDLRGMLGLVVDCNAMAASVAGRCVLGACVGHQSQLAGICERGLDLVYDDLTSRVEELDFDALRLQRGEAEMWDAPAAGGATDRRVDRLAAGTWDASIDFGMGARPVHATFVASRTR